MKQQFSALVQHFFGRFFDNEFVAQSTEMHVTVSKILALLAAPGFLLPLFRYTTYLRLDDVPPIERLPVFWFDRLCYFSYSMLVMGAVTVLEWDTLFPDRRDYAALVPLPIRARDIFLGKVAALGLFLGAFTAIVNAVSTIMYPIVSYRNVGSSGIVWTIIVHGISVLAASTFVFLSLVALEGILLNVLSVRWFRRASTYVQCGMVFALLSLFFLFPDIALSIPALKARNAMTLYLFPPVWFLALNEVLLGSRDAVFLALARLAEIALASSVVIAGLSYTIAYRRHIRRTLETVEGSEAGQARTHALVSWFADRLTPHPLQRAVVAFIGKTIARSPRHRIFLAAYIGVGCAFAMQGLIGSGWKNAALSVPLVLSFFLLSGMRFIFTIPSELPANWLFRVTETEERRHSLNGARSTMIWLGIAPLFLALAPFYFARWGPGIALAHLAFSVTISMLMIEILLLDFWKIPFTCSYRPGKANVTILWIVYWLFFMTYAYWMSAIEIWMVRRPVRLVVFYAIASLALFCFYWYRRWWDQVGFTLIFEDAPDPIVRTLGLSESAWRFGRSPAVSGVVRLSPKRNPQPSESPCSGE